LAVKDNRFNIVIQDNASTDGTREELEAIEDSRLVYRRNETNIGPLPNAIRCLSDNDSEYIMVLIDKDLLNVEELSSFIDVLEQQKPDYGYVRLECDKDGGVEAYDGGTSGIKNLGYLSKHPSGYFYRSELWDAMVNETWFKNIKSTFDFPFDNVAGALSLKYRGMIINKPLIKVANKRNMVEGKTYTYNEKNFFFAPNVLDFNMSAYLQCLLAQDVDLKLKGFAAQVILQRNMAMKTVGWKNILANKVTCEHYNLAMRNVGIIEMLRNMSSSISLFRRMTKKEFPSYVIFRICTRVYLKVLVYISLAKLKVLK
jgi:glycosyltransferase involved in cell wall biosynthesis